MKQAVFIDYNYCAGCHTCEIACQQVLGLEPEQFGIKLAQVGPDELSPRRWQLDNIPLLTDRCDRCEERQSQGKLPLCVQSCETGVIKVGALEDLVVYAEKSEKYVIFG